MQLLIRSSKLLILAALSFNLTIAWYGDNTAVSNMVSTVITGNEYTPENAPAVETVSAKSADSVWGSMRQQFKLDHMADSKRVQAEIRKLLADQDKLHSILEAAEPYIYFIYKQTQAVGLPAELALIPVIESEFNPNDHSKVGATGLWQLMPQTARELGIKVKPQYDGRRNVVASTNAALAYFHDLGNNYFKGNWYLAIAAYDCGQVKVAKVAKRAGSHDYWDLPLPKETKAYVPKLMAVAAIIANPDKYGVKLPHVNNQPYFAEIKTKKPVSLNTIAKKADIDLETLQTLNPDYKHTVVPNKKGFYTLLVPVEKESEVRSHLADVLV